MITNNKDPHDNPLLDLMMLTPVCLVIVALMGIVLWSLCKDWKIHEPPQLYYNSDGIRIPSEAPAKQSLPEDN